MDRIDQLNEELTTLDCNKTEVENQLQAEYNKIFEDSQVLRETLAELNRSNQYGTGENGEIYAWVRFDASKFEDCREYLSLWLSNECAIIDWENDALMLMQGGCLIIAHDGDVYDTDSQKTVVNVSEYIIDGIKDTIKRNQLIESWMDANGYFPGVFQSDSYGDVSAVNTTAEKV